ncbi:hypothetical protein JAAARDRAFT_58448 [Jaapia argillacea MUCL 33604]|uniref:Histone acetyltransferase n=1 Tax=Jaapia argillacea MUCL 33604 TaxID=933084 RepID=A0A067PQE1_9AGAM|nr:hypothetical protein JAAARDRAFT_58448 [Jaapia argillacea MUCL 33604]
MPGLPFPANAVFNRENSYDVGPGTPLSTVDDIPIDPALNGPPPIDPAILGEEGPKNYEEQVNHHHMHVPSFASPPPRHYSQGPQGDPFAPQPPAAYFPPEQEQPVHPTKPVKKKRKPRREEECSFCEGSDAKNRDGEPEVMVTCVECGRSGHPSCMNLRESADIVRSYPWKCIECKPCEICKEKGDDNRILFCDFCDRGWHMDCLNPPIEEEPPGKWHCPRCPPIISLEYDESQDPHHVAMEVDDPPRAPSVASSSRSAPPPSPRKADQKRKAKVVVSDDSEDDDDEEEEEEEEVEEDKPAVSRKRVRKKTRRKGKARMVDAVETLTTPRPKGMRLKISPPQPPSRPMVVRLRLPPRGKGKEREEEEPRKGLFDDVLSPEDRDTSKTVIDARDKSRFDRSRTIAEGKLAPPAPPPQTPEEPETPIAGPSRPLRSAGHQFQSVSLPAPSPGPSASPVPSTPGATYATKSNVPTTPGARPLRIRTIRFGEFDIQTWYDAPFPEEYANIPDGRLWICEFCLKYMKSRFQSVRHRTKCKARHPPGDEIYRDGAISIFEVDGRKNKIYCQNLCLLVKMFLDHKSLFYDVEPFLFYVMTEVHDNGARFVGYFSKEKRSPKDYNVSCIMTLPVRQRQGWGNLLIDFSYLLSKKEQRVGSPEKPLSGLGALGYKNYWTLSIMRYLRAAPNDLRLEDISAATSMTIEDIYNTLLQQNMITVREVTPPPARPAPGQSIKIMRGRKSGVARRQLQRNQPKEEEKAAAPFVAPTEYEIHWNREHVERYLSAWEGKGYLTLRPEKLKWSPFLLARVKKTDTVIPAPEASSSSLVQTPDATEAPDHPPSAPSTSAPKQSPPPSSVQPSPELPRTPKKFDSLEAKVLNMDREGASGSPASALFDDDGDVLDARAGSSHPSGSGTPVPGNRTPEVPRRGKGRNTKPSTPLPASIKRTRSSKPAVPFTPPPPARSRSRSPSANQPTEIDDAALAARLSREVERPKRPLRSRSGLASVDLKRTVSPLVPDRVESRNPSPRKRRKVEVSTPVVEDPETVGQHGSPPPSPLVGSSQSLPNGHHRGASDHQPSGSRLQVGVAEGGIDGSQPVASSSRSPPPQISTPTHQNGLNGGWPPPKEKSKLEDATIETALTNGHAPSHKHHNGNVIPPNLPLVPHSQPQPFAPTKSSSLLNVTAPSLGHMEDNVVEVLPADDVGLHIGGDVDVKMLPVEEEVNPRDPSPLVDHFEHQQRDTVPTESACVPIGAYVVSFGDRQATPTREVDGSLNHDIITSPHRDFSNPNGFPSPTNRATNSHSKPKSKSRPVSFSVPLSQERTFSMPVSSERTVSVPLSQDRTVLDGDDDDDMDADAEGDTDDDERLIW